MTNLPTATPPAGRLLSLEPVPRLLTRIRAELSASFVAGRPLRVARAPGRLDVMGGIAGYTGSLVCEGTLDRAAAVAVQRRDDRQVQVFSFNLFDVHQPFTLTIALDDLARGTAEQLRAGFAEPGRRWAGYLLGTLFLLHEQGYVDLRRPEMPGLNIAVLSTIPIGAGVGSSAAIEVATMLGIVDELGIPRSAEPRDGAIDPMLMASLCQQVENRIVGAPCGIMDQVTCTLGEADTLLRLVCQPYSLQAPLTLPRGIRAVGINSNVRHSVGGGKYGMTRCAAFMGHRILLDKMQQIARAGNRALDGDPLGGYLANLDPWDYKRFLRGYLPEEMRGSDFIRQYGSTHDRATTVDPDRVYDVRSATDHHVLEAMRVRNFVSFVEEARLMDPRDQRRKLTLDKAGHLMYASHVSYTRDARLGADECDLLVDLVRANEHGGLYGAKITGGGSGGTVAVLANETARADAAIGAIMAEYARRTGREPEAFLASSPGAWWVGTEVFVDT